MTRRGITLMELLLSLAIVVVVAAASTRAFMSTITFDEKLRTGRDAITERASFEDQIRDLLKHAWVSASTTDEISYFIAGAPTQNTTTTAGGTTGGTAGTTGGTTGQSSAGGLSGGGGSGVSIGSGVGAYGTPNEITFTAAGLKVPDSYLASNDDDVTQNQNFGPQGGLAEVGISQQAAGAQAQGQTGIFLRIQTPADTDPTQGGNEQLITDKLSQIGFEFFDGQNWDQQWDNRSSTPLNALPAAVRITYRFKGDDTDHVFIVSIPASTATYLAPVTLPG